MAKKFFKCFIYIWWLEKKKSINPPFGPSIPQVAHNFWICPKYCKNYVGSKKIFLLFLPIPSFLFTMIPVSKSILFSKETQLTTIKENRNN